MNYQEYQEMCDRLLEMQRKRETTMRIGEALAQLERLPKEMPITISMEWVEAFKENMNTFSDKEWAESRKEKYKDKQMYFDGTFDSDRGDYANMYLGYTYEPTTFSVQNLIDLLNKAKEQGTMEGYKGGTFTINDDTLLTIAEYGFSEGIRPVLFELKENEVVMRTKYVE